MEKKRIALTTNELSRTEVFCRLREGTLIQAQAADYLGFSIRQIKRLF